ncbi:MAG: pirin family protein [Calditrichia bacterium]
MSTANPIKITVYPPALQGKGAFDNGKITEIKPIGFPQDRSHTTRIGPLFYWAWASANGDGLIALHPHQGFEIISYVLKGEIGHSDTLGNKYRIGAGGAQVMQTGSGVYHQEEMFGERTEFFQIWFEPNLRESLKKQPTYNQYSHEEFPETVQNGVKIKTILGRESLIVLDAEAEMADIEIEPGKTYEHSLAGGHSLTVVTVLGNGKWLDDSGNEYSISKKDFTVIDAEKSATVRVTATGEVRLHIVLIEIPREVNYPLYD